MDQLSAMPTLPDRARAVPNERWRDSGVLYHGERVLINTFDGTMAYEADGYRLVSLPEDAEERIVDLMVDEWRAREGLLTCQTGRMN